MQKPQETLRVTLAFQTLFQREPTEEELLRSGQFLQSYPATDAEKWSALTRILLASNEFLTID